MKKKMAIFTTVLCACSILASCGSNGDDTGENWIILIIVMLAWLKGGSK